MLVANDARLPEPYSAILNVPDWIYSRILWVLLATATVYVIGRVLGGEEVGIEGGHRVFEVWHTLWTLASVVLVGTVIFIFFIFVTTIAHSV
jgi:hypothetical protein